MRMWEEKGNFWGKNGKLGLVPVWLGGNGEKIGNLGPK